MHRMLAANPSNKGGKAAIGPAEGLLFSDIRFHLGLARRDKNPLLFRPDLFDATCAVTPGAVTALADAFAMIKVRFLSHQPMPDRRHLRFIPHAADAVTALAGGLAVYDPVAETLETAEEFSSRLFEADLDASEFHVRCAIAPELSGVTARTMGLRKLGLPELQTLPAPSDQRTLLSELMSTAVKSLWDAGEHQPRLELPLHGDTFVLEVERKGDLMRAGIKRFH